MALGTGPDAPDPGGAGLDGLTIHALDDLTADADDSFPADWEAQLDGWARPVRADLYQIVYTSGTTSAPKGVMLTHGNMLSTVEVCKALLPPRHLRVVSLLPLSHLFEQAPVLMYGTMIGAEVMYVRSRNPRVIFETLRELRVNTMIVTPQLMELFWSAITREVDKQGKRATFERARKVARHLPYVARRLLFRSIHSQLGGEFRLFVSAGAYLPPELQRSWEDLGVIVLQGYGSTECGPAAANTEQRHPVGVVGRHIPPDPAAAGRGQLRDRGRRSQRQYRLLAGRRGHRGCLPSRRLVPHRRHRPLQRATATWCCPVGPRTSSCCPTA